jgi:hypothetical protein
MVLVDGRDPGDRPSSLEHHDLLAGSIDLVEQPQAPRLELGGVDFHVTSVHDH